MMKINIAKNSGFCFGVRRAIKIAVNTARSRRHIEMLGDIVHNENVIKMMQKAGIKRVKRLSRGKGKTLLIQAHGIPASVYKKAKMLGYNIIDATCPMVKEIHSIVKAMEGKEYKIVVIGDKKHDEVTGINGQLKNKAVIIDEKKDLLQLKKQDIPKTAIVVQSTQDADKASALARELRLFLPKVKFFNTICKPTRQKQEEIKTMSRENDVMIIIGSKYSANTQRLYQISKLLNKRTYQVQSDKEVRKGWIAGVKSAGISSGASTPDYVTRKVVLTIKKFRP
ncbi:MAG: 4-hydroxy-3-methylbut-2-enyl diphosphate reductase [Candidatus Omnitrophota bacterium]